MDFEDPDHRDAPHSFDFMAASPYAHIAYALDMTVIDLNWRHSRMTGVPREAAVGRKLFDVFPPNPDAPEADVRPAVAASLDRMVAGREPDNMTLFQHDLLAPGHGFVERYWQITHSPIFEGPEDTGDVIGALQTTRDVTKATVRRKIAAAQQRAATIGGQLSFFALDCATDEIEATRGFDMLHGYAPGEAGQHISAYLSRIHDEDRDRTIALQEKLREAPNRTEERIDYRTVWPDGTLHWLTARIEVVRSPGEHAKLTGVLLDVTDLRQSEAELRAAVEARDILLAEVNHRVKNSLQLATSVLNMEVAQADRAGDASVERLRAAASRVAAIATVHGGLYLGDDVRSVEVATFLDTLCRHLATVAGAEERGISLDVEADEVRVSTDRAVSLALIVNELVTNAFKHAFPKERRGIVRVTFRRSGPDRLTLEVADNGTGGAVASLGSKGSGSSGLGQRLIDTLGRQLGAELRREDTGAGMRVCLDLPV